MHGNPVDAALRRRLQTGQVSSREGSRKAVLACMNRHREVSDLQVALSAATRCVCGKLYSLIPMGSARPSSSFHRPTSDARHTKWLKDKHDESPGAANDAAVVVAVSLGCEREAIRYGALGLQQQVLHPGPLRLAAVVGLQRHLHQEDHVHVAS